MGRLSPGTFVARRLKPRTRSAGFVRYRRMPVPQAAKYEPYKKVGERPNIIVDGAPLASTVLTLSHWPNNQTDPSVRRDTSTATVFAYLDTPALHQDVPIVSNNHFDEDGLFSMFGVVNPSIALEFRDVLMGASLAGDFGLYDDPAATRLCFVVEFFCDPKTSPLPAETFKGCEDRRVEALYREMLPRVPELAENVDALEAYWRDQFEHLERSEELIDSGRVTIDEYPDEDLAVVHIPPDLPLRTVRRYLEAEQAAVHPFAIQNRTTCNRLLRITRQRYELQYRYESWVQFASRRPALRVALDGLVNELNAIEQAPGEWRAEAANEVVPRLYLDGVDQSSLPPERFIEETRRQLATSPVAWDPWDWDSAD
ncbi:MAG: DUF6687 family protein [Gammaproteobacteria bacterium]